MKPFNLEEAKAGKPVCTRNGNAVKILCFDAKVMRYHIVALVADGQLEVAVTYSDEGQEAIGVKGGLDLMMKSETKTGWVNLYRAGGLYVGASVYDSKGDAESNFDNQSSRVYLGACQITWEE